MKNENKLFSTVNLTKMALLSVVSAILMEFGAIKLPMFFPSFLEIDFSELPAIVGILTVHPLAGVVIVFIKNILKAMMGSQSAYVGEVANLVVALGYVLPLTLMVRKRRDIKTVSVGIILGILTMTLAGAIVNYFVVIPMYAKLFMPMEAIIGMGNAINSHIVDKFTLVAYAITPFNLLKGSIVALVSVVLVKAMQPVIRYFAHR